jgi:hypothetical protein
MARPTRAPTGKYLYVNERGDSFIVELEDYIATAGGFVASTDGTKGGLPNRAKMRHVGLVDPATGKHFTQPIADSGQAVYNDGGDLTVSGTVYHSTGRIGEHWPFGHAIP